MYPVCTEIIDIYRRDQRLWDFRIGGAILEVEDQLGRELQADERQRVHKAFDALLTYRQIPELHDLIRHLCPKSR